MRQDKIDTLKAAIQLVEEANQMVEDVVSNKAHYEAYGKYGFDQLLGNGNPYDDSLFTLLKELENQ